MALYCEIVSLHAQVREACRKLLFIPDETILCIDDHHERKSSNTDLQRARVDFSIYVILRKLLGL